MNKKSLAFSLLALFVVTGCARREEAETVVDETPAESAVEAFEETVPEPTIAPVTVQVKLSPLAEAALKAKSEKIAVVATYSGDPKASEQAQRMTDPSGMIKLGENKQLLDAAGSTTFRDDVVDQARIEHTLGEVQFTVNVTSSKTATPENLLACPFYWETLANASKQTVQIACKAMSEVQE